MALTFLMVLHGLMTALTGVLCFLCFFLLLECIAALVPGAVQASSSVSSSREPSLSCPSWQTASLAVLMPAHNEAAGIAAVLGQLLPQLRQTDRLVVVADNCTDETAAIARACGATVLERQDGSCQGKGYALNHGIDYLAQDPPDVVVMLDADSFVKLGALRSLTETALATQRPVQSAYMMTLPEGDAPISLASRVGVFATRIRNVVRLRGLTRLGLPVILTGTGMAFPWSVLTTVDLASGSLVEDMKLGLDLVLAGYAPLFCAEAEVTAVLPRSSSAVASQRKRWEHGRFQVMRWYLPLLLTAAVQQRRLGPLALAIDLCVLPLSLLVILVVAALAVALTLASLSGFGLSAGLGSLALAALSLAILLSWVKFGRQDLPVRQFALIPLFILWKLPIYLTFFLKPQQKWIRTEREIL
ncbi:MAG: glycosyltransferase [Synechococcales cyanobacterium RU_4_20]|nr:glycosyltransferase [Synechococcales cyanobacterium RU_4_20]NJR68288.1 glycosyltransferase [Synechococcales cyanobacterium CRU_2_2]